MGKIVNTDDIMTALCQHCDSHIEMCEECGMKEIIESVPSAWIKCKDRQPEESGNYLTIDMDAKFPYIRTLEYSARWSGWNCCNFLDDEKQAKRSITMIIVTHGSIASRWHARCC